MRRSFLVQEVLTLAAGLSDDEKLPSCLCPKCMGGSSNEKSMTVGRSGPCVWWKCHRASCDFRGREAVLPSGSVTRYRPRRHMAYTIEDVPENALGLLKAKVKAQQLIDVCKYANDRYAFPIMRREGTLAGYVLRTYDKAVKPKALTMVNDYAGCGWWTTSPVGKVLIIVEDIPSAALINEFTGVPSCALLGAEVSKEKLADILAFNPSRIVVALDPEALNKALEIRTLLDNAGLGRIRVNVLQTSVDIKDMGKEELVKIEKEIRPIDGGVYA